MKAPLPMRMRQQDFVNFRKKLCFVRRGCPSTGACFMRRSFFGSFGLDLTPARHIFVMFRKGPGKGVSAFPVGHEVEEFGRRGI